VQQAGAGVHIEAWTEINGRIRFASGRAPEAREIVLRSHTAFGKMRETV